MWRLFFAALINVLAMSIVDVGSVLWWCNLSVAILCVSSGIIVGLDEKRRGK